jgi:protein-glutamine gamma-glutamyltransferase
VSATALRPTPAAPPPSAPRVTGPAVARTDGPRGRDLGPWIHLAATTALAVFAAQSWGDMVRPEEPGRVVWAALVGAGLGAVALLAMRFTRVLRAAILAGLVVAGVVAALLLAGVPARLLDPEFWGELANGLGQGITALPGLSVPYRGVDEWNRIAMLLGGTALAVAGPLLACWPSRSGRRAGPIVPAIVLSVLFAVPAVQLRAEHPFVDGAVFALLLAAVLFGERLARRDLPVAATAIGIAAVAGLAIAPALDRPEPWVDYESIAQSLGERGTTAFEWDHGYGPLDWARDGREVLRVRARRGMYWKATTLADFDGVRWREVRRRGVEDDPAADIPRREWTENLRVRVRNLRTRQFIAAGTTLEIDRSPREVEPGAPGSYVTEDRPLRRGHAYLARVYAPRPTTQQLEAAQVDYPSAIYPYLSMQLPRSVGGPDGIDPSTMAPAPDAPPAFVVFSGWGSEDERPIGYRGRGYGDRAETEQWLTDSRYARTYRLAQRLRADAETPYDYIRAVQQYLRAGFTYTETPPRSRLPLDAFLFRDKRGYCQHFSGAMALLLRMGGVPARVASGFTPGSLDADRREYVVRDLDAHSWVEAYFPSYGWITFDPTPAIAPPRAQASGVETTVDPEEEESAPARIPSDRIGDPAGIDTGAAATGNSGPPLLLLVVAGLGGVALLALAVLLVRGRRRIATLGPEAAVAELERALRRSGRAAASGLTLRRLERSLRAAPDAAAYVAAIRDARYGYGAPPPSPAQRRALRRELGAGLGLRGRLRALWALPPW